MSDEGLRQAREKMDAEGVAATAIDVFTHYYRLLESGSTGMVAESDLDPMDMSSLDDAEVSDAQAREAIAATAVVKLNGGLGTSMGLDRAKSLLEVREGTTFLDVIVEQVLAVRRTYECRLPLVFMNSFHTREDTLAVLERYPELAVEGLPLDFLQSMEPKLRADDLTPVSWPGDPTMEWCPPGHGDLYPALRSAGLLDLLLEQGYRRVFVSNADNLGATADPHVAGWFAESEAPFAIEAVRRTPSDRKGGHFATRKADRRIVLRETAQTREEDKAALEDLERHRFASTNNLWFDLEAMRDELERCDGVLGLAMIKNTKNVVPAEPSSPEVIQIETAMGAAIEVFDGATTIEVGRDRFVPVKTTNDLLVLRSDCYELTEDSRLVQLAPEVPFVDLDAKHYKVVADFDVHFPSGPPSLREASRFVVQGEWTFEADIRVEGDVQVGEPESSGTVEAGSVLR